MQIEFRDGFCSELSQFENQIVHATGDLALPKETLVCMFGFPVVEFLFIGFFLLDSFLLIFVFCKFVDLFVLF
jgi:hypothetical protein